MAAPITLPALLESLTVSLSSAFEATPKLESMTGAGNGVSLLDVKNELLLSYLQNLVFLILIKIRNAKSRASDEEDETPNGLPDDVVKKLVELRLYLDKGVRPLEERLRFQLDKIVRAADDAERNEQLAAVDKANEDDSDSDSGSGSDEDSAAEDDGEQKGKQPASVRHGPAFGNFAAPVSTGMAAATQDKTGVYRAPKITPTVMPTTDRRERTERRPARSAAMSEYIADEMSTAPSAQPSVGSNVVFGGRKVKTAAERELEDRRRDYEETNFVRLPKESKKQRAEKSKAERRSGKMTFGGEEWREIGEGADRINKLTRQSKDAGGGKRGTKALLELSRKRGRETTDKDRGSGFSEGTREIGERFNKKVKVMDGGRRDRGKR